MTNKNRPSAKETDRQERVAAKAAAKTNIGERPLNGPDYPKRSIQEVMKITDQIERREAAIENFAMLCDRVRFGSGVEDLTNYRKKMSIPEEGRKALDLWIETLRKNKVLSDTEIEGLLAPPAEEGLLQVA